MPCRCEVIVNINKYQYIGISLRQNLLNINHLLMIKGYLFLQRWLMAFFGTGFAYNIWQEIEGGI
jgi:hypothetical protein